MDELLKEHLCVRLYGEFQAYKADILSLSNAEIFGRCYEIDMMTNFYEILVERVEKFSDQEIRLILQQKNILAEFYRRWMKREDSTYQELTEFVFGEMMKNA